MFGRMNGMNSGLLTNGMDRVSSPRAGFLGFLKVHFFIAYIEKFLDYK